MIYTNNGHNINILLYHQIGDRPSPETNLDCYCDNAQFYFQMKFLENSEYHVISLSKAIELISLSEKLDRDYIVLTFDDGCEKFYDNVFPILHFFNFPVTIYPITGFLGKNAIMNGRKYSHLKILSEKKIRQLSNAGVEIGAHSVSHPKLTQLHAKQAEIEIVNSKDYLEQLIGKSIDSFAYPHGNYNNEIIGIVKKTGFSNALTCISEHAQNADSLFEIPRKYITYFDTLESFKHKIS